MIAIIGLMLGGYIITRIMHLLIDQKPHGIVIICAAGAIIVTMAGMVLLLFSGLGLLNIPGLK